MRGSVPLFVLFAAEALTFAGPAPAQTFTAIFDTTNQPTRFSNA